MEGGNFAWASQGAARKTRILDVVYNASNNELVRTKTLVKNSIISIDATPFKQYFEAHYLLPLGRKKDGKAQNLAEGEEDVLLKKRGKETMKKYVNRQKHGKIEPALEEQFMQGRLLGELIETKNMELIEIIRFRMMTTPLRSITFKIVPSF